MRILIYCCWLLITLMIMFVSIKPKSKPIEKLLSLENLNIKNVCFKKIRKFYKITSKLIKFISQFANCEVRFRFSLFIFYLFIFVFIKSYNFDTNDTNDKILLLTMFIVVGVWIFPWHIPWVKEENIIFPEISQVFLSLRRLDIVEN